MEDVSAIAEIEQSGLSPWSVAQIAAELSNQQATVLVSALRQKGDITGWCALRYVLPEGELLKIAVHPQHQKMGYGKLLLSKAMNHAAEMGSKVLYLEVRAQNYPARELYRSCGFHQRGIRRNYYNQPTDDAIIYERKLPLTQMK